MEHSSTFQNNTHTHMKIDYCHARIQGAGILDMLYNNLLTHLCTKPDRSCKVGEGEGREREGGGRKKGDSV